MVRSLDNFNPEDESSAKEFVDSVLVLLLQEEKVIGIESLSKPDREHLAEVAAENLGCIDQYHEMPETCSPGRRLHKAVEEGWKETFSRVADAISHIRKNVLSSSQTHLIGVGNIQSSLGKVIEGINRNTAKQIGDMMGGIDKITAKQYEQMSQLTIPVKKLADNLASINMLQPRLDLAGDVVESLSSMMASYQSLITETIHPNVFTGLDSVVRYYPSVEMHNTSSFANEIYFAEEAEVPPRIIIKDDQEIIKWLWRVDENLPKLLEGARGAIGSQNVDQARQFAASYRELFRHLLEKLAPDDAVRNWSDDVNHFYQGGQPTRRARLLYISSQHESEAYKEFVINTCKTQVNFLNNLTHSLESSDHEHVMATLDDKLISTLWFIKEISEQNKSKT